MNCLQKHIINLRNITISKFKDFIKNNNDINLKKKNLEDINNKSLVLTQTILDLKLEQLQS